MNRRRSQSSFPLHLRICRHLSRTLLASPVCVCDPLLDAQGPFSLAQLAVLVSNGLVGRETAVTHPTRGTASLRLFLDQVRLPLPCRKPYWSWEYDVSKCLPAGPICATTSMQNLKIWLANEPFGSHVFAGPPAVSLLGPSSQRVRRACIKFHEKARNNCLQAVRLQGVVPAQNRVSGAPFKRASPADEAR